MRLKILFSTWEVFSFCLNLFWVFTQPVKARACLFDDLCLSSYSIVTNKGLFVTSFQITLGTNNPRLPYNARRKCDPEPSIKLNLNKIWAANRPVFHPNTDATHYGFLSL